MPHVVQPQRQTVSTNGWLESYASWLDWNIKGVLLWSLWFLSMGIWFAFPTGHAIWIGVGLRNSVAVPGAHGTSLIMPLIAAIFTTAIFLVIGVVLIVSCALLWFGWLKRPTAQ